MVTEIDWINKIFIFTSENFSPQIIFSLIGGGVISSFVTASFAKKREKNKIVLEIQSKVSQELLKKMRAVNYKLAYTQPFHTDQLKSYNEDPIVKLSDDEIKLLDAATINVNKKFYKYLQDDIRKKFLIFQDSWFAFSSELVQFIIIFEHNEIVMNKFTGFKDILLEKEKKIRDLYNQIFDIYNFEISNCMFEKKAINQKNIDLIEAICIEQLFEEKAIINMILYDFNIETQNEFMSKLFKHKLPRREPTDEKYKVYKVNYKHSIPN